jgi:peptidoglycan/LPS O-acetylase OafA/YrhL
MTISPDPGAASENHIMALDGVRGLAVLLVMAHHFALFGRIVPETKIERLYQSLALGGWIGVDLFFVLSGFLITGILYDAKGSNSYFRGFYARRVLRIFPLYYLTLLFVFLVMPSIFKLGEDYALLSQDQFWYWAYLANWRIAAEGWPEFGLIGHFWSLAIEEQFYILWPLVVFYLSRRQLLALCVALIVGSFLLRVGLRPTLGATAIYVMTPMRMDTLATGAWLALAIRGPGGLSRLARFAWPAAVVAAIPILYWFVRFRELDSVGLEMQTFGFSLLALFFGALLVLTLAAPTGSLIGRLFSQPALTFLGRYSYGLYVYHHFVLFAMDRAGVQVSGLPRPFGSQLLSHLLYSLIAASLSLALALLSWHLFEKRFLRLKARFPYQRASTATAPSEHESVDQIGRQGPLGVEAYQEQRLGR